MNPRGALSSSVHPNPFLVAFNYACTWPLNVNHRLIPRYAVNGPLPLIVAPTAFRKPLNWGREQVKPVATGAQ
jgi:hypothetical protein